MMLHTKYNDSILYLVVSDKNIFSYFPNAKHVTPEWNYFWPMGHNLNKLKRVLLENATYQSSRP